MTFQELGLAEPIVRAVTAAGYTTPTPIQTNAIPPVLAGRDVLGCAQTGTGKTAAFALPILHRLDRADGDRRTNHDARRGARAGRPRVLVLCPTRELATQIHDSFSAYGRFLRLRSTAVFGGVKQGAQVRSLQAGSEILVATPGRLLDLMNQGYIDLGSIETLVLDEADRMLDMGFMPDIRRIVDRVPAKRQTLLFSATMPPDIRRFADAILRNPVSVQTAPVASPATAITQSVYHVVRPNKSELLYRLLTRDDIGRTLVFTRTKYGADKLVKTLRRAGIDANAIHGDKTQNARTRALQKFKSGRTPVLVATDIASRGIDVDEITHVVNFDLPNVPETYVHRIGRTARGGASGIAISFCDHEEIGDLRAIERLINRRLEVCDSEGDLTFKAPETHSSRSTRNDTNGKRGGRRSYRGKPRRSGPSHPRQGRKHRSRSSR
ncbi:MAG: DEAD/DEAH box helicase [Phycisphaerales bacterium]